MSGGRPANASIRGWALMWDPMRPNCKAMQGQLWDSGLLEQWYPTIVTLSMWAAHMGLAGPHNMGIEFI